jgi:AcrR family transcriptional regulator
MARRTTTRERLIATAAELFWRQGYAQTGVNEIINQAEATSGSFYHFFTTKEDLLLAVVDHLGELFETDVFSPATDGGDPMDRLGQVLEGTRRYLAENDPALGSPMGTLAAELAASHPRVRERIEHYFSKWRRQIEDLLDATENRLPEDLDRHGLAQAVLSAIEGGMLQARVHQGLEPFDASIDQLRSYLGMLEVGGDPLPRPDPVRAATPPADSANADWRTW